MRAKSALLALFIFAVACQYPSTSAPTPVTVRASTPEPLSTTEVRLREAVSSRYGDHINLLQKAVDIPSGSLNMAGVRKVGELFAGELLAMGFEVELIDQPDSLRRGPHLVAVHKGTRGPRILLIGHLDTVFEGDGQGWVRQDSIARGAGTSDMKGGDVGMLLALRALDDVGLLREMQITVVMTGDEESTGHPISVSRAALLNAGRNSDIALGFEGGSPTRIALGRRGSSGWRLSVTARQGHSAGVFSKGSGYGAIYEGVRVLNEFRSEMAGEPGLTFNVGLIGGGTHLSLDTASYSMRAAGKANIIAPAFIAQGDLRFFTDKQRDSARARMRMIAEKPLQGTQSSIEFSDGYPGMPETPLGEKLLSRFSASSQSLGYPAVSATPPEQRGAADISFVAPFIPGLDGLGVSGEGAHSPRESIYLPSLKMSGERAAIFMSRLIDSWPVK